MLTSLFIKNYALIDELSVDLTDGLVILTGETGAGKSIIVDAFSLLLGERASVEVVRSGAGKATVEGVFSVVGNDRIRLFLEEIGLDIVQELVLCREVSAKGQSRCFINDTPVSLSVLKRAGDLLVDLHGQHEHQSLLRPQTHIEILDAFGNLEGLVREYQAIYVKLGGLAARLNDLRQSEQQLREINDFRSFQLREIDSVDPYAGEEEALLTEIRILENSERLFRDTRELYELLYGGNRSVYELLSETRDRLHSLVDIDKQFQGAVNEAESATAIVKELARFVQDYASGNEFHPERIEEVRNRLGRLGHLKQKYGGTIESVLAVREKLLKEMAIAGNVRETVERLAEELMSARKECGRLAMELSSMRREASGVVEREVVSELRTLGISNAGFSVRINQTEVAPDGDSGFNAEYALAGKRSLRLNSRGFDEVEFLISTNLGEETRPLDKVASGGEISRIMLALKSILAKQDRLPVVVFDEIDIGVSGRVARAVGMSLKNLSKSHQVIVITHLPQIAGLADAHYGVYKTEDGIRTETSMRLLSSEERVQEVARLLSGTRITAAALTGARELTGLS